MANSSESGKPARTLKVSELDAAKVRVTTDQRLVVEFRIQDLVRKLIPGSAVAHCGGCNGCMGCSM